MTTAGLNPGRGDHTATLLPDGKVLVAGGYWDSNGTLANAETYDPTTAVWTDTGSLSKVRDAHTATLLQDGKVLVAGGEIYPGTSVKSAEVYDPASGMWSLTGELVVARYSHTATLLPNGKVLIVGGLGCCLSDPDAEIYDPASGTWTLTGSTIRRHFHTATLLPTGKVLVVGGVGNDGVTLSSAQLYDPATGRWAATGSLLTARTGHTATSLADGRVLVAGGTRYDLPASAEVYDPTTGVWTATGFLTTIRASHTATLLQNGKVLVASGSANGTLVTSAEVYDPTTGLWEATGPLAVARYGHTATILRNGNVLVVGGFLLPRHSIGSAEVYTPAAAPVSLLSAASRLSHGSAGTFDINMPLSGPSGIEDRRASTYTAVFRFDVPVTSGNVTISSGTATIGPPTFIGQEISVPLTQVTNAQRLTLHVANVNDSGLTAGDVTFGFLVGDTTVDALVNFRDISRTRSQLGNLVTGENFRLDVTADGNLNRADVQLVKSKNGTSLP